MTRTVAGHGRLRDSTSSRRHVVCIGMRYALDDSVALLVWVGVVVGYALSVRSLIRQGRAGQHRDVLLRSSYSIDVSDGPALAAGPSAAGLKAGALPRAEVRR